MKNGFFSGKAGFLKMIPAGVAAGLVFGLAVSVPWRGHDGGVVRAETERLREMQYTFRAVADSVLPVVVELEVTEITMQTMPDGYSWPFSYIEPDEESEPEMQEFRTEGLGSGIIVRKERGLYYIATNNHVIGSGDEISVRLPDGDLLDAQIVGRDERKDLAVVSIETDRELDVAVMGDSDSLHVGDWVMAVGNPLGYASTVTAGVVSAIGRNGPAGNISDFIQTDASINQGNSGGALVNLDGEVVGMNTWIATPNGVSIGLGFAIPVNNIKKALDSLIDEGFVDYGWLGVNIGSPDEQAAIDLKVSGIKGALVHNVYRESPADIAGLIPGDYITEVNGLRVESHQHFTRIIGDMMAGDNARIRLVRDGSEISIDVVIGKRETDDVLIGQFGKLWPGFSVIALGAEVRRELRISESVSGVLASVEAGSVAYDSGLRSFDIITAVNGTEINNVMDFYQAINDKNNKNISIDVTREDERLTIGMER